MIVHGSTQTSRTPPRIDLSGELFETLSRVQEMKNDLRVGKGDTNHTAEKEGPKLEELQKMVLRPGEVPLEERLSQVISLEDIQRILLVRAPVQMDRSSRGHLVDRRA